MFKEKNIKKIAIFMMVIIITFILFINKDKISNFKDVDSIISFIRAHGKYASIWFIVIFALKPVVFIIPSAMISICGGILFGPIGGFIMNMMGFYISGTIAFFISRMLGRNSIEKMLRGRALDLNENLEKRGFKIIFLLRLPPVVPYDPLSYACGLSKIRYRDFILASILGVIPETLCYSFMGENILDPFSMKFIIPLLIIIIATASSGVIFSKTKNN